MGLVLPVHRYAAAKRKPLQGLVLRGGGRQRPAQAEQGRQGELDRLRAQGSVRYRVGPV